MDATNPATAIKVGPYHGSVGFVSHPHANQFLNSPHAKFTGTFAQIPTGQFKYDGTGEYKSYYMTEGEAANTGNGCTGCHDVHTSIVAGETPFAEECTECHAKDLSSMIHSGGVGTPLEHMGTDPMEACVSCHMPAGEHLFRISVDPTYSTKPAGALTGERQRQRRSGRQLSERRLGRPRRRLRQVPRRRHRPRRDHRQHHRRSEAPHRGRRPGCELHRRRAPRDRRCRFALLRRYRQHQAERRLRDLHRLDRRGRPVTLAGNATKTVTNAAVEQNPVKNLAVYFTKAQLAVKAAGIHNDKPYVTFGYTVTPTNTLQVNVDASFSSCSGDIANCDAFIWNWGDGDAGHARQHAHGDAHLRHGRDLRRSR